ncbi:type I secretion system permease/ATPase [Lysobacter aestuarii]|uniref:Type I secretion system permease/ATPase n=1 Tax=Marilutibacter aestuarii TaxID=1706195 RepID=A0A508AM07_9GAMM|nr:type I secretion system permease/ATPase [Lysobacter aestuarii]
MSTPDHAPWLEALLAIARHYRIDASEERVRVEAQWRARDAPLEEVVELMARQLGLVAVPMAFEPGMLDPWRVPLVIGIDDGLVGVVDQVDADGVASVRLSGEQGLVTRLDREALQARVERVLLVKPASEVSDARVDEYIQPVKGDWLLRTVLQDWPRYLDVMLASVVANILTLAAMLFTMQVYDRVIPAQSIPTLWVLFGGLLVALSFAFVMRVLRTHISEVVGKRADLRVSDRVFGHALRIRNDARPRSTGSFIAQIRELEQIRELVTSTTVGAIADLPFFFLFLVVIWLIGGHLALVPLLAIPVLLVPGLLAQRPLARLAREGMRESSLRSAMLVETVHNLDDIKLLRAEPRFQNQWNHLNETTADVGMRLRGISGVLVAWTQEVQQLVYTCVVLVGAYAVMDGALSVGVLVGCSMLASRMVAPLSQMTGVMVRWQQAKVAREGLDELMSKPVDQPERAARVHRTALRGRYELTDLRFGYPGEDDRRVLDIDRLVIAEGERVALLGRNGAGKSTLLQLLAGMQYPREGRVVLDGVKTSVLDPMDTRRDVGLLNQNASLFFGTLRENLTLGRPHATDADLLKALRVSGAESVVRALPDGLDHRVQEGGRGLSGGQRQLLLLARTLLGQPNVLLLDEPTAWLDDASERRFITSLGEWLGERTLVVATHRPAVLKCVDRIIVIDGGRVLRDGRKDEVLVRPASASRVVRPASERRP